MLEEFHVRDCHRCLCGDCGDHSHFPNMAADAVMDQAHQIDVNHFFHHFSVPIVFPDQGGYKTQELLQFFDVLDQSQVNKLIHPMDVLYHSTALPPLEECNNLYCGWDTVITEESHLHWLVCEWSIFEQLRITIAEDSINMCEDGLDPARRLHTTLHIHYVSGLDMLSEVARSHERITELEHRLDLLQRNLGVATEFLAATQPGYAQLLGLDRPAGP